MPPYILLIKKVGETPLEALTAWRQRNPLYRDVRASYAGRLDPMASGKLLILLGEECKRQATYTNLDKEYEVEVLLGVGSDTGDVLGIPTASPASTVETETLDILLKAEEGKATRAYPLYSSKTVLGAPLFLHALRGTIELHQIPTHLEEVYRIDLLSRTKIAKKELEARVMYRLSHVSRKDEPSKELGKNFRIEEITAAWKLLFASTSEPFYEVLRLRVVCASGTYMRSLAERIGERLHTRSLALSITRTQFGRYRTWKRLGIWTRRY